MKKNKNLFHSCVVLTLAFAAGCTTYVTPDPIKGYPEVGNTIDVPQNGESGIFYETQVPVTVTISGNADAARFLKKKISSFYTSPSADKQRGDIHLMVQSHVKKVTAEPQCRLQSNILIQSGILRPWKCTVASGTPRPTPKKAEAQLLKAMNRSLDSYVDNVFLKEIKKNYNAVILRFHSVESVEKLRKITGILSAIDGVKKVTVIERNNNKKIVSFRIFYKNTSVTNGMTDAFIKKQQEMDR